MKHAGREKSLAICALAWSLAAMPAQAENIAAPLLDLSALPPLGTTWREANPYRGLPQAIDIGRSAYAQACARCHGADASHRGADQGAAPDLSRVDAYCRRIADSEVRRACMLDNDAWFSQSVREGKVRVGVRHMPAWQDLLPQEAVWAIQAYVESRRP